jgi:hypothetical protein
MYGFACVGDTFCIEEPTLGLPRCLQGPLTEQPMSLRRWALLWQKAERRPKPSPATHASMLNIPRPLVSLMEWVPCCSVSVTPFTLHDSNCIMGQYWTGPQVGTIKPVQSQWAPQDRELFSRHDLTAAWAELVLQDKS